MGLPNCHRLRESSSYQPSVKGTHFHYRHCKHNCVSLLLANSWSSFVLFFILNPSKFTFIPSHNFIGAHRCLLVEEHNTMDFPSDGKHNHHISPYKPWALRPAPCKALSRIWARTVVFRLWDWFPLMLATSRPRVWLPEHLFLISGATCFLDFHFKFTYKYPLGHRSITTADHKHE